MARQQRLPLSRVIAAALLLAGCEPISMTMLGIGAGTGVNHHLGGIAYRTFTEPNQKVRKATLVALKRMTIKYEGTDKIDNGEVIRAEAADRSIEIELEALTPNTTRMRTVVIGCFLPPALAQATAPATTPPAVSSTNGATLSLAAAPVPDDHDGSRQRQPAFGRLAVRRGPA